MRWGGIVIGKILILSKYMIIKACWNQQQDPAALMISWLTHIPFPVKLTFFFPRCRILQVQSPSFQVASRLNCSRNSACCRSIYCAFPPLMVHHIKAYKTGDWLLIKSKLYGFNEFNDLSYFKTKPIQFVELGEEATDSGERVLWLYHGWLRKVSFFNGVSAAEFLYWCYSQLAATSE